MDLIKERLKEALQRRPKLRIAVDAAHAPAAVLVPLFYRDGEYHVVFTKRTGTVRYHKGQVSFPGGACEAEDRSPADTALRECTEEIGLITDSVEIIGELDDMLTVTSNYVISPYVAVIPWPYKSRIDPTEVERIIEVPVSALLDKDCLRQSTQYMNNQPINVYAYYYKNDIIWGATARILGQFLEVYEQVLKQAGRQG